MALKVDYPFMDSSQINCQYTCSEQVKCFLLFYVIHIERHDCRYVISIDSLTNKTTLTSKTLPLKVCVCVCVGVTVCSGVTTHTHEPTES